jgi:hypothetical protein
LESREFGVVCENGIMQKVLSALASIAACVTAFGQEPTASVTIHVVDKDGFTVEGCRVDRFAGQDRADLSGRFQGLRGTQIPWGLYDYRLKRPLAAGREGMGGGRIGVTAGEMFFVVQADNGLLAGLAADGTYSPRFAIKGRLDPIPPVKSEPTWIRLSPVHGSVQWDESVDSFGEFRIHHPLQGLYLLTVIQGSEVLHVQPIVFGRGFPAEGFTVKLTDKPPAVISPERKQ